MKSLKTIKCWGIPYGLTTQKNAIQEVTIEKKATSIKAFVEYCEKEGIKLTGKPYVA